MKAFCYCLSECSGDVELTEPDMEWNMETLLALLASVTDTQLLKVKGDAQLKPKDGRTPFQSAFLASFNTLLQIRKQSTGAVDIASLIRPDSKLDPKLKLRDLRNMDQLCSRYNEVTAVYDNVTLLEFAKNPKLFLTLDLILLGPDGTTGFGKTAAATVLSLFWLSKFVKSGLIAEIDAAVAPFMTKDNTF